jgi:predicted dienelactone hydrolase
MTSNRLKWNASAIALVGLLCTACNETTWLPQPLGLQADLLADAGPEFIGPYSVGHSLITVNHAGRAGENRPVDVHLWYPADHGAYDAAAPSAYRSRLLGLSLIPGTYDPLSFEIPALIAHEGARIDHNGPAFPLLIWSHGNTNDALDYAYASEAMASHGFVVASLNHPRNAQDYVLTDFLNQLAGRTVLGCLDGLPRPCVTADADADIKGRLLDVSAVLDYLEQNSATYFDDRVDLTRVGMIGHSRGANTAVAAVAGSAAQGIAPNSRIRAIMTMAAPAARLYTAADGAGVRVPALLMVGGSDETAPPALSQDLFGMLSHTPRIFVTVKNGDHRSFDSAYCPRMQAAGAVRLSNPRAILEDRTVRSLLVTPTSGSTLDYCAYNYFVDPVDIRPLVKTITGIDVTPTNVPRALGADEMSQLSVRLAVGFFHAALDDHGSDGLRFTRFLTPKYLMNHEPNVQSVKTILAGGASCPDGQGCTEGE